MPAEILLAGAFFGRGWQGATLLGCLRGISAARARARPEPGRRCIWEHVLHAAYWKYAMIGLLDWRAADALGFDRAPANWPAIPPPASDPRADEALWKRDVGYLKHVHAALVDVARAIDPDTMHQPPPSRPGRKGRSLTRAQYLAGIAAHDAYHCGQIQLIKRLTGFSRD